MTGRSYALVIALCCLASRGAIAAPSAAAMKEAKAHYAQGRADQDAGAWDDAVREYEAAYKIVALPELLFNIGQCQRLKGDKQKALEAYQAYLVAVPEGSAADDARDHIASLKLRIQVDEAEAARKRATEDAEAARHQAQIAEETSRRLEAERAQRRAVGTEDDTRMHQVAELMAEAEARKQAAAQAAKQRRLADARNVGRILRIVGGSAAGVGLLMYGGGWLPFIDGHSQKDTYQHPQGSTWTPEDQAAFDKTKSDSRTALGLWSGGAALLIIGATVAITGAVMRSRAIDRVQATLAPLFSPSSAGLAVTGQF